MANETDEQGTDKATDGSGASVPEAPQSAAQKRAAEKAAREAQASASTDSTEAPAAPAPDAPTFTRERLLGAEGEQITGHPLHIIAGALADTEDDDLTREQVSDRIETFLARPVSQED